MSPRIKYWCEQLVMGKTVTRNNETYRAVDCSFQMTHSIAVALERGAYIKWESVSGTVDKMTPTDKCRHDITKRGK